MPDKRSLITLAGFILAFTGIILGFCLNVFGVITRVEMSVMIFACLFVALVGGLVLNRLIERRG